MTDLPTIAQALEVPLLYLFEGELTATDLDHVLLKEFQRLPSLEAKRSAIEILRLYTDAIILSHRLSPYSPLLSMPSICSYSPLQAELLKMRPCF